MNITFSDLESKRFDISIYRANASQLDCQAINEFVSNHPTSLLICRIPVSEQCNLYQLNKIGIQYLVADTLVYYEADIQAKTISPLKNDLRFEEGKEDDKLLFDGLVSEIFSDYTNHYFSNPILPKDKIIEGYQEWVSKYYTSPQSPEKVAFLVKRENEVVGFATCDNEGKETAEGVLYGVRPNASGGGVYTDIMRFTQSYYQNKGVKRMKVSTQIQNFAVQKAWIKEGFTLSEAYLTLHIFHSEVFAKPSL